MIIQSQNKDRSGVAAVEVALVLMVLLVPMLLGVWEIGRLVNVHQLISNTAREAGRQASTAIRTNEDINNIVLFYLQQQGLSNITEVTNDVGQLSSGKVYVGITVYDSDGNPATNSGGSPLDVSEASQNDQIEITISIVFNDVDISATNFYLPETTEVSTTVSWNCMRDVPLIVNQGIPLR